ncbi:hypothetical protein EJB05_32716 [Eragrostis curvula]|uniref:DUF3741 domain-containing protein n=1 Tax=Eragrostis curvula TaxID=38414 RepID=A0A5J9UI79_9POAL|nr:hypothetical protein EJB05_32716 [Eragrostis curvula]
MSLERDYLMAPSLSKHFAEDLLRGAMDLQESLAMLERFQAASQSMRQSDKKRRPETGQKSPDIDTIIREVLLRPSNAKKVLPRTVSNGLHGQIRNSPDELKNLAKDSLHKKNLLSVYSNNEQASLSQSARYAPNNYLVSKSTQQKKVVPRSFPSCAPVQIHKSTPSLVAKLMGLDGLPSQNDNSIMKDEKVKTVSSPRALFDIEMPKSKRLLPQFLGEDSRFDTEMHVSEKLPPERYNAGNYTRSHNVIGPSYDTPGINEFGSMKSVHRERNIEQVQGKSSKEIKVVSHTSRKQQTKETPELNRRTREKQKSHLTERSREGRKEGKEKAVPASRNAKILKRPDKKLAAPSNDDSMKPILQKAPRNSRQKTLSRRNVKSSTVDELVAYQIQKEIVHVLDESDGPSTEHSATPSDENVHSADWDAESSVDDIQNDFSESSESFTYISRGERISSADEDVTSPSTAMIPTKEDEIKDEISLLLLSDQSFLRRAAELMGIGSYNHLTNQYKGTTKAEMENRELYLDTAAEQLERKLGHENSLCHTGFQGGKRRATTYFSLEALLRDISNGIRKLNSYADADACGTTDSLHMKLERDLWCTDTSINGVWDLGWQDWICMEETECFVRDVGDGILSLLIEEAALAVLT